MQRIVTFHGERQNNMNTIDYTNQIIPIIKKAGLKIIHNFRFKRKIENKNYANYVTDLDKSIEAMIMNEILSIYPNEFFISEEDTHYTNSSNYWILDPIDGTTNLLHNFPSVAISLAHYINNEVVFGVVYCPNNHELFYAEKNKGSYLLKKNNKKELKVSTCNTLSKSLIGFGCPYDKNKIDYLFELLKPLLLQCDDIKRVGPASLDLCNVAAGRLDAYIELDLEIWDYSAGGLILKEAGGTISDFYNNRFPQSKSHILATNNYIHQEILDIINQY